MGKSEKTIGFDLLQVQVPGVVLNDAERCSLEHLPTAVDTRLWPKLRVLMGVVIDEWIPHGTKQRSPVSQTSGVLRAAMFHKDAAAQFVCLFVFSSARHHLFQSMTGLPTATVWISFSALY